MFRRVCWLVQCLCSWYCLCVESFALPFHNNPQRTVHYCAHHFAHSFIVSSSL